MQPGTPSRKRARSDRPPAAVAILSYSTRADAVEHANEVDIELAHAPVHIKTIADLFPAGR